MDFEDDFDDLDQILSNLPSGENLDKDEDSADELLDILMDEDATDTGVKNEPEETSCSDSDEEGWYLFFIKVSYALPKKLFITLYPLFARRVKF